MAIKAQSLAEAIQLLQRNKAEATILKSSVENVPGEYNAGKQISQNPQQTVPEKKEKSSSGSILVAVSYQTENGPVENQEILIRRAIRSKDDIYLDGIAMDIRAPRLIKVSHVTKIHDLISGRIWTNPYEFIQNRLDMPAPKKETPAEKPVITVELKPNQNDFQKAVERIGTELTVLMYLVAIDGVRDKSEREKVFEYALSRTADLTYDKADMMDYIISLAPNEEIFSIALAKSLSKDQKTVQELVETMLDVIMVDGRIDPKERAFLVRIMDLLEQAGYEIHLPI